MAGGFSVRCSHDTAGAGHLNNSRPSKINPDPNTALPSTPPNIGDVTADNSGMARKPAIIELLLRRAFLNYLIFQKTAPRQLKDWIKGRTQDYG